MNNQVITRFAPSPTGMLHIGAARTALFNYLFSKHHNGKFLLRIEDTDKERSTNEAIDAILDGMKWLGLEHDGEIIYQSQRSDIHAFKAKELVENGKAYYCFMSPEEITHQREEARRLKKSFIIKSPWRDASSYEYPKDIKPVIRLKAPQNGQTIIKDLIQGDVVIENDHLDDMILLRSDGSPTYMLAVVIDDHDMGITHIIRGDDHLTNAARQILLYEALGWEIPNMAHMPLIHGSDGAKLSKRHGALGVEAYKDMGYLPESIFNYLLRLGWSHGDEEIISRENAIKWFNLESIGKGPSRIDFDKMKHVNSVYLREVENDKLLYIISNFITLNEPSKTSLEKGLEAIKSRISLIPEMIELAKIYLIGNEIEISGEAMIIVKEADTKMLEEVISIIENAENLENISELLKDYAKNQNIKLGLLMKPLRAMITGQINSPSVFEIISIIGKEEAVKRIRKQLC